MNTKTIRENWRSFFVKSAIQKGVFLGVLSSGATPIYSQGNVFGKITTDSGKAIENVCVDVVHKGKVIDYVTSDKKGKYTVEGLTEGHYDFVVYYRMEEKKLKGVKVFKDKPSYHKISLVKKDPVIPYYGGDIDLAITD